MIRKLFSRNEDGNLFLWYLAAFGVMIGIFGLAVDTSFNVYSRNSLQNALDSAVVAAASQVQTHTNGDIGIDYDRAYDTMTSVYDQNRDNVPGMVCSRTTTAKGINKLRSGENFAGKSRCWILTDLTVDASKGTISAKVREYKPNYFLKMIGITYQEFQLRSTAHLTHNLEQK